MICFIFPFVILARTALEESSNFYWTAFGSAYALFRDVAYQHFTEKGGITFFLAVILYNAIMLIGNKLYSHTIKKRPGFHFTLLLLIRAHAVDQMFA